MRESLRQSLFVAAHLARVLALTYQRYVFFSALGAAGFGLASIVVAPALFATTFFTMVTGELIITLRSREASTVEELNDALKYIFYLEVFAAAVSFVALLAAMPFLPDQIVGTTDGWLVALLIIPASAFSQIGLNWILVGGRRSLYATVFYVEALLVVVTSQPLVEWFSINGVILAYCIRPLVASLCVVGALGPRRVVRALVRVLSDGDAWRGRCVHVGASHQIGSLIVKSAWSSLDVVMVGGLAGEARAGQYRILKTLATIPSVVISPVWSWLRPDIAAAVSKDEYRLLTGQIVRYSAVLSLPAAVMLVVPAGVFESAYKLVFPKDILEGDVLKYSMVLWWLVASSSGWVRSVTVATGQFEVSTYGNVVAFVCTFAIGPALVMWAGFDAVYIVPATLAGLNLYWFSYLTKLNATGRARTAWRTG